MNFKLSTAFVIAASFILIPDSILAQKREVDTTVTLDVLTVPNSPAFNLLGISPSTIDKPNSPTDFAFSIANASNNFSQLPKNYAVEFLPIPMMFARHKTYDKFVSGKVKNNISQTLVVSAAFTTNDSVNVSVPGYIKTRSGIGFKVSIIKGNIDTSFGDYKNNLAAVDSALRNFHQQNSALLASAKDDDPVHIALVVQRDSINSRLLRVAKKMKNENIAIKNEPDKGKLKSLEEALEADSLLYKKYIKDLGAIQKAKQSVEEELKNKHISISNGNDLAKTLKKKIEAIKFKRYGWMLDLAGGTVLGFRNDDFQNSIVQQYSVWLNGGYSCKKGVDILGLTRFNSNIKSKLNTNGKMEDVNTFDAGLKINYTDKGDKFTLGAEGILRAYPDTMVYRYTFNATYLVKKGQALTFAIGKNFGSDKPAVGGNLIATLNYILAFGSTRGVNVNEKSSN